MYNYRIEKPEIFKEENQETFLAIRTRVHKLISESGAVTMEKAIEKALGSSWLHLACVDRLVELKEIKEIQQSNTVPAQYRIFVSIDR